MYLWKNTTTNAFVAEPRNIAEHIKMQFALTVWTALNFFK